MEKYGEWAVAALTRAVQDSRADGRGAHRHGKRGFTDLAWAQIASVAGVAAVVSLLTSVATDLPEVGGAQPAVPRGGVGMTDEERVLIEAQDQHDEPDVAEAGEASANE